MRLRHEWATEVVKSKTLMSAGGNRPQRMWRVRAVPAAGQFASGTTTMTRLLPSSSDAASLASVVRCGMTGVTVPISHLAADWELAPLVLLAAGLAITLFGQALVRLRRRGRKDVGPARALLFLAGIALATLALVSP